MQINSLFLSLLSIFLVIDFLPVVMVLNFLPFSPSDDFNRCQTLECFLAECQMYLSSSSMLALILALLSPLQTIVTLSSLIRYVIRGLALTIRGLNQPITTLFFLKPLQNMKKSVHFSLFRLHVNFKNSQCFSYCLLKITPHTGYSSLSQTFRQIILIITKALFIQLLALSYCPF